MITTTVLENDGINSKSRAPSPTSSSGLRSNKNHSTSKLHRKSLTEMDQYEDKLLVTHKSYPHLRKKRSGSDSTGGGGGGDHDDEDSIAASAASSLAALPMPFASEKRNHDFHGLFKSVPENERLIEDYSCALQKEILIQGRLYISENHLCFNANIFGWVTNLVIAYDDIVNVEKKNTAIVIPNALLISTHSTKYFLASLISRDQTYDLIVKLYKAHQAQSSYIEVHNEKYKDGYSYSEDDDYSSSDGSYYEDEENDKIAPVLPNQRDDRPLFEKQSSLPSLPIPKQLSQLDEASRRRAISEVGVRPNLQEYNTKHDQVTATLAVPKETHQTKEKTECECSKNDPHFPTVVMDATFNTTLETIYKLLYTGSFMNKFLCEVEKNTDVCIGEWSEGTNCVQTRESTYIKYLGGSIGPKSTKCYLKEDMLYLDTKDYICQLTVTQTPDVPSGSSFSVKTKTCISWAGQGQVRVLVTVLVDFTKSSWLKSPIEKASIDGQQNFYKSLDNAIRKHLDKQTPTHTLHKKKKRNRRHIPATSSPTPPLPSSSSTSSDLAQTVIRALSSLIDHVSGMTTSQLTAICVGFLLLTNIYIASKMAGVNSQILQLHTYSHKPSTHSQEALWSLLKTMNTKEQHGSDVYDEQLDYYKIAKHRLDLKMAELDELISKTGQNMNQISKSVQDQQYQILNSD